LNAKRKKKKKYEIWDVAVLETSPPVFARARGKKGGSGSV
jgi:hypothetical protein